jgi:U3 small nucleolar RNA-associated protein MPP10
MSAVRRDLFEDDQSVQEDDSADALSDLDPADRRSRLSTHERRQAKLAAEIRKLEAANVAKREWVLTGEARAAERPLNSLLEEDLDFERTGKPVPVITATVSEGIEELIKRRILTAEFDEVVRRRPDALTTPADARRGAVELDDRKPQQSLAELYEADHQRVANPDSYVTAADAKLKNEHAEIERLWKNVSAKLDALSSWHYRPKPPEPSINIVADVPTIVMEDAQPATAAGVTGGESMLAPQDVYAAGGKEGAVEGEVTLKGGKPVARGELSREEKTRRRRREKERLRKRNAAVRTANTEAAADKMESRAKTRKDTIAELKRGGVKVIGKKGEVRDIEGKKIKGGVGGSEGAGMYKL